MTENKRYEFSVSPKVTFLADQSDPDKNHFVFAYTITVTNTGSVAAQLESGTSQQVVAQGLTGSHVG